MLVLKYFGIYVYCLQFACEPVTSYNPEKTIIVRIPNGPNFIGQVSKIEGKNTTFYSFRGIPYALPPIQGLRFKAPVAMPLMPLMPSKTILATTEGPSCVQSVLPFIVIGSEDCLYLSIYTTTLPRHNKKLLPVMVWIHGGFFEIGGHTYNTYGPDYFLNEGVLFVAMNYRLGVFGFLNTEDIESPGNYGLKDQILALKWIKQHIEHFGGDKNKVTLFGESAGSISVSYLSQSSLAKGLFHRAILQSGTSLCMWGLTRNPKLVATEIGSRLNVDVTSSKVLLKGLRNIKYTDLQNAAILYEYEKLLLQMNFQGFAFGPSIEPQHPYAVIVDKSHERLVNGGYHRIPYIIGMNSGEAYPFIKTIDKHMPLFLTKFLLSPTGLVPVSMNTNKQIAKIRANYLIRQYYFNNSLSRMTNFYQFMNEDQFRRPIFETISLYSRLTTVYMYIFSYRGSWTNFLTDINDFGVVGHGEELRYLFYNRFFNINMNEDDLLTRYKLIKLWTNFAKTGNPTPSKVDLLENVIWPSIRSISSLPYLDIGKKMVVNINFNQHNFTFWQHLFTKYGRSPFSTY